MTTSSGAQQRIDELERENARLQRELSEIQHHQATVQQARAVLMRGGFRLLLPLFDREKVARSFGQLAETVSAFSGPSGSWPSKEKLLADTRLFLEACVRFAVRRRLLLMALGLLGAAIPAVQIWLVVQQNQIIENQNKFFEIQVYDVVARSMTQGDRNARLMTGALLANAQPDFLQNVIHESFDPGLASVYRAEGVNAANRRLDDAAFRGHLVRAAVRSLDTQLAERGLAKTYESTRPMLRLIFADAASRVPAVLRLGRDVEQLDGAMFEQVDHYLIQVGAALSARARMARSRGDDQAFAADVAQLLVRLSQIPNPSQSRFGSVYQAVLQDFLFEMAERAKLGDPPVSPATLGLPPEAALKKGISNLQHAVKDNDINYTALGAQAGVP